MVVCGLEPPHWAQWFFQLVAALSESQQAALNVSSAADSASKALQAQAEATRSAAMANIEASGSMVGWHAMLAETASKLGKVTVSTNKARTAINLNTQAGRDNQSALDRIASTALNTAAALEKTGDGAGNAAKVIARSRAAFIDAATKMGLTKAAARELADSYGLLPEKKGTKVEEKGSKESKKQVDALTKAIKDLPKDVQTKVLSTFRRDGIDAALDALRKIDGKTVKTYIDTIHRDKGNGPGRAFGGWIDGPGSWTSDSILTPLSRDEFVIRASRATAIERVHRSGQYLSQAFARNIIVCNDSQIGFIDFEDDPGRYMPLERCQSRDYLCYLQSLEVVSKPWQREPSR